MDNAIAQRASRLNRTRHQLNPIRGTIPDLSHSIKIFHPQKADVNPLGLPQRLFGKPHFLLIVFPIKCQRHLLFRFRSLIVPRNQCKSPRTHPPFARSARAFPNSENGINSNRQDFRANCQNDPYPSILVSTESFYSARLIYLLLPWF